MRRLILTLAAILLTLGALEGLAYWWMHPAPAGLGEPVLVYRPSRSAGISPAAQKPSVSDQETNIVDSGSTIDDEKALPVSASASSLYPPSIVHDLRSSISSPASSSSPPNLQSPISNHSSLTSLPEVVAKALPSLRCSTGTAARIDRDDGVTINLAFFEWNLADSTNVLEAFKHLPEECLGSIGMTLIEKASPLSYVVRSQESLVLDRRARPFSASGANRESNAGARDQEAEPSNQPSTSSSLRSSTGEALTFDHTIFRDPQGVAVHAFKGIWVSGATDLLGEGVRGGVEQWTQIRWKSALKRFRPAHARVVQGAVRGIANPDLAWEAFEDAMLKDLEFQ